MIRRQFCKRFPSIPACSIFCTETGQKAIPDNRGPTNALHKINP